MCTAISINNFFGRNLDYEYNFGEKICITPRNYPVKFTNGLYINSHYAIIGMALNVNNYPLYFDASNEVGLSMAGLNFPHNACYNKNINNKINVSSYEFILYILTQSDSVLSAKKLISNINITDDKFSKDLPPTPLHWIISDKKQSITIEQTKDGLKIFDNPVEVLTNSPAFDIQLFNLNNYMSLTSDEVKNRFSDCVNLSEYSRGMGAIGLPGDFSSMSRFVRASFVKLNSPYADNENEMILNFFHILYSVYQYKGCVKIGDKFEFTQYTSCCDTDKGIYYYTSYNNFNINAVDMHKENLDSDKLISYELINKQKIYYQN